MTYLFAVNIDNFDPKIKKVVNEVIGYAGYSDDWIHVKKEIMKNLPSSLRSLFSTRDRKTYEQSMNDFEHAIADYWRTKTGKELRLIQLWERKESVSR